MVSPESMHEDWDGSLPKLQQTLGNQCLCRPECFERRSSLRSRLWNKESDTPGMTQRGSTTHRSLLQYMQWFRGRGFPKQRSEGGQWQGREVKQRRELSF